MASVKFVAFAGEIPARDIRLLPDANAAEAVNTREPGALEGVNAPTSLSALAAGTRDVYRIPTGAIDDLSASFWMQFTDADTDVVRTPNVNDSFERYYWAAPSHGLKYNSKARILAGNADYSLAVPAPTTAPTVTVSGAIGEGDSLDVTRSYVITWVSVFGEEGQPSPPREAVGRISQLWTVTDIPQPPASPPAGQVPIEKIRIYRTTTSASGTTTFFLVDELLVGNISYVDTKTDTVLVTQIRSTVWAAPPDMDGLISMPNGIFVGFKGNNLFFSENFRPHAWPAEYQLTVEYPIVGLGVTGNTCVVCTTGHPAAVTGTRSATMSLNTNTMALPCLSRGSIVSTRLGVIYATQSGLVLIGPGGIEMITSSLFERYGWNQEYAPGSLRACLHAGKYIAVRTVGDTADAFTFDPTKPEEGVVRLDGFVANANVQTDPWSGRALLVQSSAVHELLPATGTVKTYRWRSKEIHFPRPLNLGVADIFHDGDGSQSVILRVWADRRLVFDQNVAVKRDHIKLPSGFKADIWQFEIQSAVKVHALHVASTAQELTNV